MRASSRRPLRDANSGQLLSEGEQVWRISHTRQDEARRCNGSCGKDLHPVLDPQGKWAGWYCPSGCGPVTSPGSVINKISLPQAREIEITVSVEDSAVVIRISKNMTA
jgi:hypothetical protein